MSDFFMPEDQRKIREDFEAEQNLIGLFAVLLAVDKRTNPQLHAPEDRVKESDD